MFFSMHTMDGDPEVLRAANREHLAPVVARLAPAHGAIASVTIRTETGMAVYNIWRDAQGAATFAQDPAAQEAQRASGLPAPSSFARHVDADVAIY